MARILFTGGGSGGHIYPIIAVARALHNISEKERIPLTLMFVGTSDFDTSVLAEEGIRIYHIPAGKIRRYANFFLPWDILKTAVGSIYAFFLLWWLLPDVIFAKGSYGSFAIALVGRLYLIPLFVHESDSRPGVVNKILGIFASRIGVAFPDALAFFSPKKTALVGNPVRLSLKEGTKSEAQSLFNLKTGRPVVLILGGSQGSQRINTLVTQMIHDLLSLYEVIHQCGENNVTQLRKDLAEVYGIDVENASYYHLKGFLNEPEEAAALAVADFVISRAGAGSIYEIALAAKPSLLIPLSESASGHQRLNAFYYARLGAASVVEEKNLTPHIVLNEIANTLANPQKVAQMCEAAKNFVKPDAAEAIARELIELAGS